MTHKSEIKLEKQIRIAVFPGTFDPFTIGHRSIVERGLGIFDHIIIAVGYNIHKTSAEDIDEKVKSIKAQFKDNDAVTVRPYSSLTADFVKQTGACTILRGVRSVTDFEYERNLADVNKKILGVETVFLTSLPEYSYISSSVVRELQAFGHDVSELIN
ncbi:MAG: pantetheine-phosphate adenylyltransferase [Muribaculaceae bacterium]|nr:pantetheine-phosphate adenylyltransferase [Muribaculaceae bacterium]